MFNYAVTTEKVMWQQRNGRMIMNNEFVKGY
jgi:hypothetical protein